MIHTRILFRKFFHEARPGDDRQFRRRARLDKFYSRTAERGEGPRLQEVAPIRQQMDEWIAQAPFA